MPHIELVPRYPEHWVNRIMTEFVCQFIFIYTYVDYAGLVWNSNTVLTIIRGGRGERERGVAR